MESLKIDQFIYRVACFYYNFLTIPASIVEIFHCKKLAPEKKSVSRIHPLKTTNVCSKL